MEMILEGIVVPWTDLPGFGRNIQNITSTFVAIHAAMATCYQESFSRCKMLSLSTSCTHLIELYVLNVTFLSLARDGSNQADHYKLNVGPKVNSTQMRKGSVGILNYWEFR